MEWDLGLQGLGLLILMSLGFGVIAQLVMGRTTTRWLRATGRFRARHFAPMNTSLAAPISRRRSPRT